MGARNNKQQVGGARTNRQRTNKQQIFPSKVWPGFVVEWSGEGASQICAPRPGDREIGEGNRPVVSGTMPINTFHQWQTIGTCNGANHSCSSTGHHRSLPRPGPRQRTQAITTPVYCCLLTKIPRFPTLTITLPSTSSYHSLVVV